MAVESSPMMSLPVGSSSRDSELSSARRCRETALPQSSSLYDLLHYTPAGFERFTFGSFETRFDRNEALGSCPLTLDLILLVLHRLNELRSAFSTFAKYHPWLGYIGVQLIDHLISRQRVKVRRHL